MHAEATEQQPLDLTVYGERFVFTSGESLQVFFSNRYSLQVMPEVLATAGLQLLRTWLFDPQKKTIYLCAGAQSV